VETITNQVSVAMDNARLFEQVQLMAITDALTGIYNRRYFFTVGDNEMARAQRYGSNLSLIMLDIDHFKKVNDEFGHLVGDQTLVMITQACSNELRKIDILCRYGGEEFVILLPETSRDEAIIAAERIRKSIEEQKLTLDGDREVKVTVSIGVSEFGQETGTLKELIDEADQALYRAKEEGRNCVRVFDHSLDK
jgi:diguanylate cyclase (GGDEF)-like protein